MAQNTPLLRCTLSPFLQMGLYNAPSKFLELMVRVKELSGEKATSAYLDDVITAGDRYNEHLEQIEQIPADRAQGIKLKKFKFFMPEVQFFGFQLSKEGILPGSKNHRNSRISTTERHL